MYLYNGENNKEELIKNGLKLAQEIKEFIDFLHEKLGSCDDYDQIHSIMTLHALGDFMSSENGLKKSRERIVQDLMINVYNDLKYSNQIQ